MNSVFWLKPGGASRVQAHGGAKSGTPLGAVVIARTVHAQARCVYMFCLARSSRAWYLVLYSHGYQQMFLSCASTGGAMYFQVFSNRNNPEI